MELGILQFCQSAQCQIQGKSRGKKNLAWSEMRKIAFSLRKPLFYEFK